MIACYNVDEVSGVSVQVSVQMTEIRSQKTDGKRKEMNIAILIIPSSVLCYLTPDT
jgi:hypothetical protein